MVQGVVIGLERNLSAMCPLLKLSVFGFHLSFLFSLTAMFVRWQMVSVRTELSMSQMVFDRFFTALRKFW